MLNVVKIFIRDFSYIFSNYFIANIPSWFLRRLLYRMLGMKIGKGSRISMKCIVMSPWKIRIGNNTMVNEYVLLDGRGELVIGDNTSISMWSIIYTASHVSNSDTFEYYSKKTIIGNCCWVGTRAIVMPGSTVNDGTIISVNSSIKGTTEVNSIYSGNPAKKIRNREIMSYYALNNQNFMK